MKRIAGLLILLLAVACAAQEKRAFSIEDLYRVKGIGDLHLSPDGRQIVYIVTTSDLGRGQRNTHIWIMPAQGGAARQITQSERSESNPLWSPDGRSIAFVSARGGDGDNLWLLPLAGGEAHQVTHVSTGVGDPLWSPDGKSIAFSSDVYPECEADDACNKTIADRWQKGKLHAHMADSLLYRHWTEWKDGKRTHILLADVESGKVRDLTPGDVDSPRFQLGGMRQFDFSPDGKELCFESQRTPHPESSTNDDLWLLDLTQPGAESRNITAANKAFDGSPRYSPDGRWIAYRLQTQPGYESDRFRLALYDRQTHQSRVLTDTFQNWVEDFQWAPDSKKLYFSASSEGNTPVYWVGLESPGQMAFDDAAISAFDVSPQGNLIVYTRSRVGEPVEIYSESVDPGTQMQFDRLQAIPHRLTHLNEDFTRQVDVRPAESMWFDGARATRVHCFVVKPHGFDPARQYPLILNVHGGPQQQWANSFRGDWQVYPGAGYVVAFCNPHGSTGYGQAYTAEISGDYGGAVMEDIAKATDALAKLPYVDPDHMGVMGWSWGGYAMDWIAGHPHRFNAIASMMGLYNLTSFYGATEELWFPEWDLKGQPWNSADYANLSPSNFAKNFRTPTLIISGERDYRVPYTQSLEFFTALQKMDVPPRLIIYSDAGHWPSWYEMALYYTAHLEWFQKYLGGGAPPWTTAQFLRNQVFDPATGERYKEAPKAAPQN